jgi:HEAT repeat protein
MALFALIEQDPENRFLMFEKSLEWLAPDAFTGFVQRHGDKVKRHVAFTLTLARDDLRSAAWRATELLSKAAQSEIATGIAAKNERQALRIAAIERLVELDGKNAAATLEAFVKDGDEKVRVFAIAQMARIGHKAGVSAVSGDLDDPSERVRVAVATALIRL